MVGCISVQELRFVKIKLGLYFFVIPFLLKSHISTTFDRIIFSSKLQLRKSSILLWGDLRYDIYTVDIC